MKVYVLMENDFPAGIFSSSSLAELAKTKLYAKRAKQKADAGSRVPTYLRVWRFELDQEDMAQ